VIKIDFIVLPLKTASDKFVVNLQDINHLNLRRTAMMDAKCMFIDFDQALIANRPVYLGGIPLRTISKFTNVVSKIHD
jgi:hypothetical protein